jgi:hypothetical protein
VGRHGGRSDERYAAGSSESGHGVGSGSRSTTGAGTALAPVREGVTVPGSPGTGAPESPPLGVGVRATPRWWEDRSGGSVHPWWDEAPVPPPVVVASADGRTPVVTFSPEADPFSAGGLFARGARDGEPAVVVHPAPDAAVLRAARRPRPSASTTAGLGSAARGRRERDEDGGPDTGSLVRPYVAQALAESVQLERSGSAAPSGPPDADGSAGAETEVPVRRPRRARRSGDPLELIVEVTPPASRALPEWSAPWTGDGAGTDQRSGPSLFQPVTLQPSTSGGRESSAPWRPPREQPLPSRRSLRAQERSAAAGNADGDLADREPGSRTAGRRIAKSGVLAVTAVGVVAATAPNAFSALGLRPPSHPVNPSAQAALVGLAGSGALPAPGVTLGSRTDSAILGVSVRLSDAAVDTAAARQGAADAARQSAAAAARARAVASGAGRTLVDVAREQVRAEAARKAQIAQQVSRNTVRDPRAYARLLLQERGWGDQFGCLNLLWNRESGWNYQAYNPSSGAYGIPQALPGSKMASIAADWRTNPATQIRWGLNYIAERYGTPCGAWSHSEATGWY